MMLPQGRPASAAAPLWAGIAALLNAGRAQPVGQMHATPYVNADACRDVTQGDNRMGAVGFAAGPGWEACTGLGSSAGGRLRTLYADAG